jgi:hypothetical protein
VHVLSLPTLYLVYTFISANSLRDTSFDTEAWIDNQFLEDVRIYEFVDDLYHMQTML